MLALKVISNRNLWEEFLLSSEQANFLQSWAWGEMHRELGQTVWRYGLYQNNRLIGLIQLIKVAARRATYWECPGGPVIDWKQTTAAWLFKQLKQLAKQTGASFIRIRPNILATKENLELVRRAGLRRAPMHLTAETTWVLALDRDEAAIFNRMRKTSRYLIRKAEKLGVQIIQSTDINDIDLLFKLQQETVGRKHFVPFSREYFAAEFKAFLPDSIRIFKALYQGRVLAAAMIIFYGREAVYHYSGSSNRHREVPVSYRLQWEAIKAARERQFQRYNFWGYTSDPKHRFYGPSLFKQGFGGQEVRYLPAHDLVVGPGYWPNWLVETMRRKQRRL